MKYSLSSAIQVFDMSIPYGDILDKIRKLPKIATNFGHFVPSQIL